MPTSTKRKAPAKLAAPVVKSAAGTRNRSTIDESRTSVAGAGALHGSKPETINISSDEDSDEDISDEEIEDAPQVNGGKPSAADDDLSHISVNGRDLASRNRTKDAEDGESDEEPTSPSFGELLRGTETIDVPSLLNQSSTAGNAMAQASRSAIAPPSHQSLTTVLSQALRTDDVDLLESCLHTTDLPTIRNTIETIDSSLAGVLLTKLASRLHRRPGRAGNLMTWVQWTLIAHGGALASQPKVISNLSSLQKVLAERAKGLNSLLALKGKLDLLEGQMDMRRKMQKSSGLLHQGDNDDDDDDKDVIWVEGETDGARDGVIGLASRRKRSAHLDSDDDDDDDIPVVNGYGGDSDDEDDDDDEEDSEDDVGAEEGDLAEESLDEDEVDHDDVDESMGEDEESDVDAAAPPSKMQKVGKNAPKRR